MIVRLKKLIELWRFYGSLGFLHKCWEKLFLDPRRYVAKRDKPVAFSFRAESKKQPEAKVDKPIKIWYLVHCFFPEKQGGTERFVLNLAQTQQKLGHQVRVITLSMEPLQSFDHSSNGIFWREFRYQNISVLSFRYRHTPLGLYYKRIDENDAQLMAFARMLLAECRPNVVHCAYGQPMAAFLKICREESIPYIMTLTGFDSLCHYTTMIDKQGQFCPGSERGSRCEKICRTYGIKDYRNRWEQAKRYLLGAAYVAVPSKYVSSAIAADFNDVSPLIIPHGIQLLPRKLVPNGRVQRFVYVGTLTEMKGIPLLLEAFRELPEYCSLDIYGHGTEEYKAHLQGLSSSDARIRFHGSLPPEKIGEAYQNADCVVVPSLVPETYNFVLREALQSGCVVIAARIGAMPEAVKEGENGFLFTPGDKKDLLRVLHAALTFDWSQYRYSCFPSVEEEGKRYEAMYAASIQNM